MIIIAILYWLLLGALIWAWFFMNGPLDRFYGASDDYGDPFNWIECIALTVIMIVAWPGTLFVSLVALDVRQ